MDRRTFLVTLGTAVTAGGAGCIDGVPFDVGGLDEDDFDVGMSANAFLPDSLEVEVGDAVVWGNNGSRGHTVTAYDDAIPDDAAFFASGGYGTTQTARDDWRQDGGGTISPGETFEHVFEVAGSHHYFCIPHERGGMTGVVSVTE